MVPSSDTILAWGTGGLSVGVGLYTARMLGRGISWLFTFFTGRLDRKEAHLDESVRSLIEGLKAEIMRLTGECRDLRGLVERHGKELAECRRKHAESEAEVMQLKAMMQGYGDAREKAQLIMAAEKRKDAK